MILLGVRVSQDTCVGLGVRFTKSAKLYCGLEIIRIANMPLPSVGVFDGETAC